MSILWLKMSSASSSSSSKYKFEGYVRRSRAHKIIKSNKNEMLSTSKVRVLKGAKRYIYTSGGSISMCLGRVRL